jgi:7-carboxy-7-deazaguanine synthase
MKYTVKEICYTLQGEGAHTGRAAVLCRFAGCNLWSGREAERLGAVCNFCDTDFVGTDGPGGGVFHSAESLSASVAGAWPCIGAGGRPLVVFTGGEPLLQLDRHITGALRHLGFEIAVETNGTLPVPEGVDWVCVSPKAGATLAVRSGDELKLVFPQKNAPPEEYQGLDFRIFYLQPLDGPERLRNTQLAVRYCLEHPPWRLSLQTHKLLGIR